eukprot:CAMPEP_0172592584 /NCGR_PEP_ID=MMETSP1068-20121228/11595_1 /TAXON_ID=35684 /ORGANISM="Pseudopedinella elastica, Strain CCMP716" /LENGTH=109 /DNA_ID=CAMNT_0013389647 /DNA_START=222 /DNA_END=547 /DNA_ORIENTATION=+
MMLSYEIEAKDMSIGPTAEEKRWAARKACMFAAMGGSAEDLSDFENWHHPAVLKGEVRRYEAAMKHAVAASTTTAAERLPCWSQFRVVVSTQVLGEARVPKPRKPSLFS